MLERVTVREVVGPDMSVNDAMVVMSSDITRGVWQAFGGGQFLKTTLALLESNSPSTMAPRAASGPGLV